jgi:hypothetical protein
MAKRKGRKRPSGTFGFGTELLLLALVILFIGSGGAAIVNHFLDGLGFHGLPSSHSGDNTWLILGIVAVAIGGAIWLWRRLGGSNRSHWASDILGIRSLSDIYAMSPSQFEQFVAFLFEQRGFAVRVVGQTGDQGIDIELRHRSQPNAPRVVAQCKRYEGSVGQPIVREFYGSFVGEAVEGYLVTTGLFTQPAQEWAASRPLHLIDGPELLRWTESVAEGLHRQGRIPSPQIS